MSYDCGQASAAARHDNRSQIFARLPIVLAEAECLLDNWARDSCRSASGGLIAP